MAVQSNFHTHSIYCDGKDTPAQMAAQAFSLGFFALGFSGHSDPEFSDCGMKKDAELRYREDVAHLKAQYAGRMEIYCGVERDILAGPRPAGYDYAIGSVHWLEKDGRHLSVDWKKEITLDVIRRHFGGDPYAYAAAYYALVSQVKEKTRCDVIGHFDLLTKFDEGTAIVDNAHPRYRAAVALALDALCAPGAVFEINTGAMAKGYRKTPYPALWILKELHKRRCAVMINSDCHDRQKLAFGFDLARELALEAGFTGQIVIQNGAFQEIPL